MLNTFKLQFSRVKNDCIIVSTAKAITRNNCKSQIRRLSTLTSSTASAQQFHEKQMNEFNSEMVDIVTPFAKAKIGSFFQQQPRLGNQFIEDVTLRKYLKRYLPQQMCAEIFPDLERFGHRVANDIFDLHVECDRILPKLEHYDSWGKRVDRIITCQAWKEMKRITAEEGVIAIGYDKKYEHLSRLYQLSKMYLFCQSSGFFCCPVAATDGAARSLEVTGDSSGVVADAFERMTTRDPTRFWTSGQWMTERRGGSDVANGTETVAVVQPDGSYKLYGYKWFSSVADSDVTLTLARISDGRGNVTMGTKGLSMFFVVVRDANGNLNNIEIQKLKDKLGTRQLPTAELLLDGTTAYKVSEDGRGIASIATMLKLTRIHNALTSAGAMRRMVNLARDYATKRLAFGKLIKDHPLHVKTLANMEIETRAATLLTLDIIRLLGLEEYNKLMPTESEVFRIVVPIAKLYTAKQAMSVLSEGLECFGGMGYLEDTTLPQILRDSQVLPIWEGTTNILSLDVLRAIAKSSGGSLKSLSSEVARRLAPLSQKPELKESASKVERSIGQVIKFASDNPQQLQIAARDFAYSLARTYMGVLMLEQAGSTEGDEYDILSANRWCQQDLVPVLNLQQYGNYNTNQAEAELNLVYAGWRPSFNSKL